VSSRLGGLGKTRLSLSYSTPYLLSSLRTSITSSEAFLLALTQPAGANAAATASDLHFQLLASCRGFLLPRSHVVEQQYYQVRRRLACINRQSAAAATCRPAKPTASPSKCSCMQCAAQMPFAPPPSFSVVMHIETTLHVEADTVEFVSHAACVL
jgi:hypothetical protein